MTTITTTTAELAATFAAFAERHDDRLRALAARADSGELDERELDELAFRIRQQLVLFRRQRELLGLETPELLIP